MSGAIRTPPMAGPAAGLSTTTIAFRPVVGSLMRTIFSGPISSVTRSHVANTVYLSVAGSSSSKPDTARSATAIRPDPSGPGVETRVRPALRAAPYPPGGGSLPPSLRSGGQRGSGLCPPRSGGRSLPPKLAEAGGRGQKVRLCPPRSGGRSLPPELAEAEGRGKRGGFVPHVVGEGPCRRSLRRRKVEASGEALSPTKWGKVPAAGACGGGR